MQNIADGSAQRERKLVLARVPFERRNAEISSPGHHTAFVYAMSCFKAMFDGFVDSHRVPRL